MNTNAHSEGLPEDGVEEAGEGQGTRDKGQGDEGAGMPPLLGEAEASTHQRMMMPSWEPLDCGNLVAIDFETGGLVPGKHPPLQLGAVSALGMEFCRYIVPAAGMEVEAEALAVCGYDPDLWEMLGAAPLGEVMREFRRWLLEVQEAAGGAGAGVKLAPLGHNACFDRGFLRASIAGAGMVEREAFGMLDYHWECSATLMACLRRAGVLGPGPGSSKLAVLRELSGYGEAYPEAPEPGGSHDALEDARVCLHGYRWLLERVKGQGKREKGKGIRV